jgi:type I restriction enzyme M protein
MLTGELRSQVDGIWNDFWSGGLANPLQVIEHDQLFDLHQAA